MRRVGLSLCIAALLTTTVQAAHAADLSSEGAEVHFSGSSPAGHTLAVFARPVQRADGTASLDVLARRVGSDGRPVGSKVLLGQDAVPGPNLVGEALAVAYDARRGRWLVAWSGREPGMPELDCSGPARQAPVPAPACRQAKREIFVRVVDRTGRAAGPARKVTATGADDDVYAVGAVPALAYDRRTDRFLVVSIAVRLRESGNALVARSLRPDGTPAGAPRSLPAGGSSRSAAAETRVVSDPSGGFLLAYIAGGEMFDDRELYTRALTADGDPEGEPAVVSQPGRPGVGGLQMAGDGRDVLAVWAEAPPGGSSGWRARRLAASGVPRGEAVSLSFTVGTGRVAVAAFGTGWVYAFTAERPRGGHAVLVRRAQPDGSAVGASRVVSEDDAVSPGVTDAGRGRALVGWTHMPVSRETSAPPPPARPRVGLIRP